MFEREKIDWPSLTDDELLERLETQIWLSAFANNNPRAPAHAEVDAGYDECRSRGKPWLYQKAYNRAYRSCGYTPPDADIEKEKPESWAENKTA